MPAGNKRKLRVSAQPNVTLTMDHVPRHCRRARVSLLGPLTQTDLDATSFVDYRQGRHKAKDRLCYLLSQAQFVC